MDFQLTPHFSFYEMTNTDHKHLLSENRIVTQPLLANGYALCASLLEPVRVHFDKPVVVHSGYRCLELNTTVGGSKTSQHIQFEAVDFHVTGIPLEDVFQWIWKDSHLRWGQLIREGWAAGHPTWIHLSLGEPWSNKQQEVLTFEAGQYTRLQ